MPAPRSRISSVRICHSLLAVVAGMGSGAGCVGRSGSRQRFGPGWAADQAGPRTQRLTLETRNRTRQSYHVLRPPTHSGRIPRRYFPVRRYLGAALLLAAAACGPKKDKALTVQTAPITRRNIIIDVEATGVIEAINPIDVKSKASGVILKMPVETGSLVKTGDLLVQIDPRDVQNKYESAKADVDAAAAKLRVSEAAKKRNDELFKSRVITTTEHEGTDIDYENAKTTVIRMQSALDLAKQALEDATVAAPSAGTVIDKPVSVGQVIASATNSPSGGTTLLTMADLGEVRVR